MAGRYLRMLAIWEKLLFTHGRQRVYFYCWPPIEAVPDHRRAAGRRHRLSSILALTCCGMRCGNRSLLALAEWGRADEAQLLRPSGVHEEPEIAPRLAPLDGVAV